jgi:hypothetical protein
MITMVGFVASHLFGADPMPLLTKDMARNAITVFRQGPLSQRGLAAGELVRRFAEKDDSVIVQISDKVVPFLGNMKIMKEDQTILLDAFVVGNVDAQFLRNEKKDDPYSGVTEMIETYKQMKKRNPSIVIEDIDKFMEMEKRGELKTYLASP